MGASLDDLPVELYLAIISQFEDDDRQQSLLALSRAIPRSPVPTRLLYERVSLRSPEQVIRFNSHIRKTAQNASLVRYFLLESWTVDADVVVNLMALLPSMVRLTIYVGPNFAPEHMEEILRRPKEGLRFVSLRFRP